MSKSNGQSQSGIACETATPRTHDLGYGPVPRWIVTHGVLAKMTFGERGLYLAYCAHANGQTGVATVGNHTLASLLACSPRTISRQRAKLVERGALRVIENAGGKGLATVVQVVMNHDIQTVMLSDSKHDSLDDNVSSENIDTHDVNLSDPNIDRFDPKGRQNEVQTLTPWVSNQQKATKNKRRSSSLFDESGIVLSADRTQKAESIIAGWPKELSTDAVRRTVDEIWNRSAKAESSRGGLFLRMLADDGVELATAIEAWIDVLAAHDAKQSAAARAQREQQAQDQRVDRAWEDLAEDDRECWRTRARADLSVSGPAPGKRTIEHTARSLFAEQLAEQESVA